MKPDSLIFDMDGTLWDAVDTYAYSWTQVLKDNGINKILTREELESYMGMEMKQIFDKVIPDASAETVEKLYNDVIKKEHEVISEMGGKIYPGVLEGLEELSGRYKLFMLSNCQEGGIKDFMNYTETKYLFTDYMEYGMNFQPKHINLKILIDRHNLKNPMYVGDTDSDRKQCELVHVPFVFISWGFGNTEKYALRFDKMQELTDYFMHLDKE
ncbi:MAG TPA: hypothetical protein DIT04_12895 [Dysgonomonas sp.]|nr:hypothetical protein [Dysgonomonas sp.]